MTKTRKPRKQTTFEGLPIVDAAKDIDLVIKKRDVDNSVKKDPNNCAAALAGRRELQTDVRVYISRTYVKDKDKKRWIRFITPNSITKEIVSFDRGATFEPGEYVLKAPTEGQRLGYKPHRGGKDTGTGRKKRPHHVTANVRLSANSKVGKE